MLRLAWLLLAASAIHGTQDGGVSSGTGEAYIVPSLEGPSAVTDWLPSADGRSEAEATADATAEALDVFSPSVDGRKVELLGDGSAIDAVFPVVNEHDVTDVPSSAEANATLVLGDEVLQTASAANETAANAEAAPPLAGRKRVNCSSLFVNVHHSGQSAEGGELVASTSPDSVPLSTTELHEHSELPSNSTDAVKPEAVPPGATQSELLIVNNTQLAIAFKSTAADVCTLLILYAPWCPFCARFAPHINAAVRAFPDLRFLAVNGATLNSLNSKYATVAVPNVILLHGPGKFVARFNYTDKSLQSLIWFVQNTTNLTATSGVNVTAADYGGPLPAQPVDEPDYYLHASLGALLFSALYCLARSGLVTKTINWLWPSGARQHQLPRHEHVD